MPRVKPPCKECKDRELSCHKNCDKYKQYREELNKYNNNVKDNKSKIHIADIYAKERSRRRR